MIDLHCHILPGVDDGASSLDEALAMARFGVRDGITYIVATPHCHRHCRMLRADVLPHVARLNQELAAAGVPLRVLPGSEVQVTDVAAYRREFETELYCHLGDRPAFSLLEFNEALHVPVAPASFFRNIAHRRGCAWAFGGLESRMADVAIDVPRPLLDCFLYCEVNCVRECCGIDAFSTDLGRIAEWGRDAGPAVSSDALRQLRDLIAVVEDRSHKVSSAFLNHYTCDENARQQFVDFLAAFRSGLESVSG